MEAKTTSLEVPACWCTCHEMIFGEEHILCSPSILQHFPYCRNLCNMEIQCSIEGSTRKHVALSAKRHKMEDRSYELPFCQPHKTKKKANKPANHL